MAFEDDLLDLEREVLALAAGDWLGKIDEIRALLLTESPALRGAVLELLAPTIDDTALVGLVRAAQLGADEAATIARLGNLSDDLLAQVNLAERNVTVPASIERDVRGLGARAAEALDKAKRLLIAGAALDAVTAPLIENQNRTRLVLETAVNAAANQAIVDVAEAGRLPLVWVAERDACVVCLAYAGRVVSGGETFPGGLTFGAKSYNPDPVSGPPRHPHCRCHVEPLNDQSYADALKREAVRSILRGYSLENESMTVRLEAAQRLINGKVDAPASVIKFAQRSIKAGAFPTRNVPGAA